MIQEKLEEGLCGDEMCYAVFMADLTILRLGCLMNKSSEVCRHGNDQKQVRYRSASVCFGFGYMTSRLGKAHHLWPTNLWRKQFLSRPPAPFR